MHSITKLFGALLVTSLPALLGQTTFTKITTGEIATDINRSFGVAWGDFDGDGWVDLFIANGYEEPNGLYRNNGDGTFTVITSGPVVTDGGDSGCGVWADLDNNGGLDLYVTNYDPPADFVYSNSGKGEFANLRGPWDVDMAAGTGAAWADYDLDGFVDIFIANWQGRPFLYRNTGAGSMELVESGHPVELGGPLETGAWADYDNDGDPDLFVSRSGPETNLLYRNEGRGSFVLVQNAPDNRKELSVGAAWADYDNDGDLDLFVPNNNRFAGNNTITSHLYRNEGNEQFFDFAVNTGGSSHGACWADFDNDGYLDLFVPNTHGENNYLFFNQRDGTLLRVMEGQIVTDGGNSWAVAAADYDNDGAVDLCVSNGGGEFTSPPEANFLYRNDGNANAWLLFRLIGTVSNRSAIGAKVRVRATIRGQELWQLREISGGSGWCSQNDLRAHFGLGDATTVDLLRIEWPSGIVQEFKDVSAKQILTVTEPARLIPQGAGAFQIQCWINQSFEVQASMDLVEWSAVETVTNLTGTLVFEDAEAHQHESRYYRVVTTP